MNDKIRIEINPDWCKGCEIWVDVCPKDCLEMKNFVAVVKDLESCTGCKLCEQLCPDFGVVVHAPKKKKQTVSE